LWHGFTGRASTQPQAPTRRRRAQRQGPRPWWLALAGRAQQIQPGLDELGLELAAEVVLVRDHDLPDPPGGQLGIGVEDPEQGLAFVGLRPGQGEPDRQPVQRAQQMQ
jgi:hypothetical protein